MSDPNKVLIVCCRDDSREPSYEIVTHLKEFGYSCSLCHIDEEDDPSKIKADQLLDKETSLSGFDGVIFLDDGGDPKLSKRIAKKALEKDLVIGGYGHGVRVLDEAGALKDEYVCHGLPKEMYDDAEKTHSPSVRSGVVITSVDGCALGFAVLVVDALGGRVKNIVNADQEKETSSAALVIAPLSSWPNYWNLAEKLSGIGRSLVLSDLSDLAPKQNKIKLGLMFDIGSNSVVGLRDRPIPSVAWLRQPGLDNEQTKSVIKSLEDAGCKNINSIRTIDVLADKESCNKALSVLNRGQRTYESTDTKAIVNDLLSGSRKTATGESGRLIVRARGKDALLTSDNKNLIVTRKRLAEIIENKRGKIVVRDACNEARIGDKFFKFAWVMVKKGDGWSPWQRLATSEDEAYDAGDVIQLIFPEGHELLEGDIDQIASLAASIMQSIMDDPDDLGEVVVLLSLDDATPSVDEVSVKSSSKNISGRKHLKKIASMFGLEFPSRNDADQNDHVPCCFENPGDMDRKRRGLVERELSHEGIWVQPDGRIAVNTEDGIRIANDIDDLILDLKAEAIQALEEEVEDQGDDWRTGLIGRTSLRARHRLRLAMEIRSLLPDKRQKMAEVYPSDVAGPFSHLDLSIHERVFTLRDGDDWLTDREKSISDLPRYNPEYDKITPGSQDGFYFVWDEVRREPTDWIRVINGDDTVYPMRNLLKK